MQHAGRCQGPVTGGQALFLVTHLNQADAFQDDVQLVMTFVSVRRVLLARLERVQSGKEKFAFGNGGLAHFAGRETGQAGDASYKHDLQCTRGGAKVPLRDAEGGADFPDLRGMASRMTSNDDQHLGAVHRPKTRVVQG